MQIIGDTIINNPVQVLVDTTPPDGAGQYPQTVNTYVNGTPPAADYTFENSFNGIVNNFQTATIGTYIFRSDITWANPHRTTTQTVQADFTAIPVNVLTQTHELVEALSDPCNKVGILVTGSRAFDKINDTIITPATSYQIDKNRDEPLSITIRAADDQYISTLMNSDIISEMQTVIGADIVFLDVTVEESPDVSNPWTYDFGAGYQSLNKFHYSTAGEKTIYIKDLYGCIKTVTVEAIEIPTVDPESVSEHFYVSKANSFRYVDRMGDGESFDDCTNYKTDERTFDCEVPYLEENFEHTQKVKRCAIIKTQIKSNYLTHEVELWNKTSNTKVADLTLTKVQANLQITDSRDCYVENDEIYSYIYFIDGKVPYFYQIGAEVIIGGETRQIYGFDYIDNEASYAIKVSLLPGALSQSTIDYVYNRQDYDVYEFEVDAPNLASESEYYVKIHAERGADIQNWQTSDFYVENSFDQSIDIEYYNNANTDVYYQSGITNRLVIGIDTIVPVLSSELSVISTDSRNFLRESLNKDKRKMTFEPLTLGFLEKLIIALSHEKLVINGTSYACEALELNIPNENVNLYVLSASLYKSNDNVKFVAGAGFEFDWSSGQVTFDSSITFDRTTT